MFNNILLESGEYDLSLKIFSPEAFAEYSPILSSVGLKDKIESFKSENLELCKSSHLYDVPICTTTEKISEKTVKSVHSGNLYLSQSATDAFSSCPFAFHCKYSLKLKNRSNSSIASSDLGTLIHSILQNFLESTSSRGILKSDELTAEEISRIIRDEIAKSSALLLEFTSDDKKARVKHLLDRIADITVLTASNLVDEFRQSGFEPAFFELPIREYGDNALIPIKIALDDGSFIVLGGICDRVDTMVKDDTLYVRVADYKSGDKVFSLDNIRVGQSLQLLIYLFSIWENADKKFKLTAKAKITDTVIPAGAEYVMTTPSAIEASIESTYESLLEMLSHSFKRSGIYLSDQSILEAMDKGLTTKYIPVKDNLKDQKGTVLMTVEQLQELKTEVGKILVEIGNSIKHGKADALPLPADSKAGRTYDACAFCEMKPICKNISNAYFDEDESN